MHSPTSEESDLTTTMSNDNERMNGNYSLANPAKRNRNNVFICGFLPTRLHNKQLNAVAHELMPNFFVCSNPTVPSNWSKQITIELLSTAGAVIFLMNKFTLNDRYCMATLQYAYALGVKVIMLRHPSMKLVVNIETGKNNQFNEGAAVLRNAICESYKSSIEYDKSQHSTAMNKIFQRLRAIFSDTSSDRLSSFADDPAYNQFDNYLRLPAISPPPKSPLSHRPSSTTTGIQMKLQNTIRTRSRSSGNLKNLVPEAKSPTPIIRRPSVRPVIHLEKPATTTDQQQQQKSPKKETTTKESFLVRQASSRARTDDPTLYNETQYLVFHYHDKTQPPRLIRFPSDIILHDEEIEIDDDNGSSIWGSDTSLEEEAERATRLQGHLDFSTPPITPKPYIEPL